MSTIAGYNKKANKAICLAENNITKMEDIMFTMYVYVLDTLADWEPGYVISELNSGRFFKRTGSGYRLKQSVALKIQSLQWAG